MALKQKSIIVKPGLASELKIRDNPIFLTVCYPNPAIQRANKAAYKLSDIMKYA